MKTAVIITSVVTLFALIFSIYGAVWANYIYPKEYEYALQLADDASLPNVKAEYLSEYLGRVETITGEPRYVFMKPDLELSKQKDILRGLIKRFEDIAEIESNQMAYQQGMGQLSGQEINHQLSRISRIFYSAKLRESFINYLVVGVLSWLLIALCILTWFVLGFCAMDLY